MLYIPPYIFLQYYITFIIYKAEVLQMQNELRKEIKLLKALQNVSYTEIAEHLEIHRNSLYNWLNG